MHRILTHETILNCSYAEQEKRSDHRGEIKGFPKKAKDNNEDAPKCNSAAPHQMVVNGANMPLAVDEAGHYERAYAFGRVAIAWRLRTTKAKA